MTDQPRDLAAEVAEIKAGKFGRYQTYAEAIEVLLAHIAALSIEVDEITAVACGDLEELAKLRRELEKQREALRWCLDNGAHNFRGSVLAESMDEPPEHLREILSKALEGK